MQVQPRLSSWIRTINRETMTFDYLNEPSRPTGHISVVSLSPREPTTIASRSSSRQHRMLRCRVR